MKSSVEEAETLSDAMCRCDCVLRPGSDARLTLVPTLPGAGAGDRRLPCPVSQEPESGGADRRHRRRARITGFTNASVNC